MDSYTTILPFARFRPRIRLAPSTGARSGVWSSLMGVGTAMIWNLASLSLDSSEVNSMVGSEQQSEELVKYLMEEFENNPTELWETKMFGKSLHSLVNEGLQNKLLVMPQEVQKKMRRTLGRIVNEGKGGVICILL